MHWPGCLITRWANPTWQPSLAACQPDLLMLERGTTDSNGTSSLSPSSRCRPRFKRTRSKKRKERGKGKRLLSANWVRCTRTAEPTMPKTCSYPRPKPQPRPSKTDPSIRPSVNLLTRERHMPKLNSRCASAAQSRVLMELDLRVKLCTLSAPLSSLLGALLTFYTYLHLLLPSFSTQIVKVNHGP